MKLSLYCLLYLMLSSAQTAGTDQTDRQVPEPTPPIRNLLRQIQSMSPSDIGLEKSTSKTQVWGVLMETGYVDQLVTLVVLADGSTNLYFGQGGGMFGLGGFKNVRQAAKYLLLIANRSTTQFKPEIGFNYPQIGHVKFTLLTFSGPMAASGGEDQLENGKHHLSELFFAGQKVISELFIIDD